MGLPHSWQNLESSSLSWPQAVHLIMMTFSEEREMVFAAPNRQDPLEPAMRML